MSLQVWLPLTESLKNNGLAPLIFSAPSSGISTTPNGKLGRAYACTSLSCGGIISNSTIQLGNYVSMFCWVYLTGYDSAGSNLTGIISNHSHDTSNGCGFGLTLRNTGSAFYVSVSTGPSAGGSPFSSRTYNTIYGGTPFYRSEWHHIGFTYDGSGFRIYLDGKEQIIYNNGVSTALSRFAHIEATKNPANKIGIFNWSTTYQDYCPIGYINDVRIYNHCLSLAEIKEIAKGKILHYQLKNKRPITNNLKLDVNTSFSIYNNPGTSNISYTLTKLTNEQFMGAPIWRLTMTPLTDSGLSAIKSELRNTGVYQGSNPTFKASTKYCYWTYWRPVSDSGVVVGGVASNINGWTEIPSRYYRDGWYRCGQYRNGSVTEDKTDAIYTSFYFSNAVLNKPVIIDFAAPHLIEGYDQIMETDGWILSSPHPGSEIEFDVSGNEHNGTISSTSKLTSFNTAGRYLRSYKFNGSSDGIEIKSPIKAQLLASDFTMSFWIYPTTTNRDTIFGDYNTTGAVNINIERRATTGNLRIYYGGDVFSDSSSLQGINMPQNTWTHIVLTYNTKNKIFTIYKNGIKAPVTYNKDVTSYVKTSGSWWVGRDSRGTSPESLEGQLSDFRLYATTFSDAEVLQLYQLGGKIDDSNNVYCYEFNEVDI